MCAYLLTHTHKHSQFRDMVKIFNVADEANEGKEAAAEHERKMSEIKIKNNCMASRYNAISRAFSPKQ